MACGLNHTIFSAGNGMVYGMGSNSNGQLGIGDRHLTQTDNPIVISSLSKDKIISEYGTLI